jgi:sporulation protein YlmC with PRC-barrel domain
MPSDESVLRCADLIGRPVYDRSGGYVGRVAEVVVALDVDGRWALAEVVVTPRIWGRLLGYERDEETGPWPLTVLARWLIRRHLVRLPWAEVRVGLPDDPA